MNERNDTDLERYLAGDDPVSARYRQTSTEAPPAELDARIRELAHASTQKAARPGWMVPTALAATVLLGVGISMQIQDETTTVYQEVAETDAGFAPLAQEGARAKDDSDAALRKAVAEPAEPFGRAAPQTVAPSRDRQQAAAAPPPPQTPDEYATAPAAASANAPAEAEAHLEQITVTGTRIAEELAADVEYAPEPPPVAADEPAAGEAIEVQEAVPTMARRFEAGIDEATPEADTNDVLASIKEPSAEARLGQSIDMRSVAGLASTADSGKAQRLQRIEELWRDGQQDEARRLLERFVEDFPDHEFDEDFPVPLPAPEQAPAPAPPPPE